MQNYSRYYIIILFHETKVTMNPNDVMGTLCAVENALDDGFGSWEMDEVPANVSQIRKVLPYIFEEKDGKLLTKRVEYSKWKTAFLRKVCGN